MKKTITNPDGSTEVVEGTADEIAQYEKAKREAANESPTPKRKKLLTEETVRAIAREEAAKVQPVKYEFHSHCVGCHKCQPYNPYPWYTQPIWIGTPDPLIPYVGDPLPGQTGVITVTSDGVNPPVSTYTDLKDLPKGNIPFIGTFCSNSAQA